MSDAAERESLARRVKAWWTAARANRNFRIGLAGAAALAIVDQASKYWILHVVRLPERGKIEISGVFDLTFVRNFGASFGLFAGGLASRIFLSLIALGVSVGLAVWLGRLGRPMAVAGVSFIIGGALGNLYDRIAYGYVVDFLDFSGLYFPWVFNVADAAINLGVACLLLDAWLTRDGRASRR